MAKGVAQGQPTTRALIHRGPDALEVVVDRKVKGKPAFTIWVGGVNVDLTVEQSAELAGALFKELIRG